MISKWRWIFTKLSRELWVRSALLAALGIATALTGVLADRFIPWSFSIRIGADSVDGILNILASSMLAVTTFSLGVMLAAYGAATTNVTPRATKLLMQDSTTQNVLAVFIGSFLFSLVGLVSLSAGAYGERGRVVLFLVTLAVIALIVATILRWIDHLSRLGRVGETTDRVEQATMKALKDRVLRPTLGGAPLGIGDAAIPPSARQVTPRRIGYIQHIDVGALSALMERCDGRLFVTRLPGGFVHTSEPFAWLDSKFSEQDDDDLIRRVRNAFTIDDERSFDQDPRFGLAVLAEIAARALSPAVNDPGTAIDVIGRGVRLLSYWAEPWGIDSPSETIAHPRVFLPPLRSADLFDDIFSPIARDGAGMIEVQLRLQKGFRVLMGIGDEAFRRSARRHAQLALERAEAAMTLKADQEQLRALVADNPH